MSRYDVLDLYFYPHKSTPSINQSVNQSKRTTALSPTTRGPKAAANSATIPLIDCGCVKGMRSHPTRSCQSPISIYILGQYKSKPAWKSGGKKEGATYDHMHK